MRTIQWMSEILPLYLYCTDVFLFTVLCLWNVHIFELYVDFVWLQWAMKFYQRKCLQENNNWKLNVIKSINNNIKVELKCKWNEISCITIFVLLLDRLNFVFKAPLLPALVIVDHRDVTTITCPSGRKIHQVNTLLTEGDCH